MVAIQDSAGVTAMLNKSVSIKEKTVIEGIRRKQKFCRVCSLLTVIVFQIEMKTVFRRPQRNGPIRTVSRSGGKNLV
jgi:hypothetical protein